MGRGRKRVRPKGKNFVPEANIEQTVKLPVDESRDPNFEDPEEPGNEEEQKSDIGKQREPNKSDSSKEPRNALTVDERKLSSISDTSKDTANLPSTSNAGHSNSNTEASPSKISSDKVRRKDTPPLRIRIRPPPSSVAIEPAKTDISKKAPGFPSSKLNAKPSTIRNTKADPSQINFSYDLRINGFPDLLNLVNDATPEVKDLLAYECKIILECRVCQSIFRSYPNFLSHKRRFCTKLCSSSNDLFSQPQYNFINTSLSQTSRPDTPSTVQDAAAGPSDTALSRYPEKNLYIAPLLDQDEIFSQSLNSLDGENSYALKRKGWRKADTAVLGDTGKIVYLGTEEGAQAFTGQGPIQNSYVHANRLLPFMCHDCNVQFYSGKSLEKHKCRKYRNASGKEYIVSHIEVEPNNDVVTRSKTASLMLPNEDTEPQPSTSANKNTVLEQPQSFPCKKCSVRFSTQLEMSSHFIECVLYQRHSPERKKIKIQIRHNYKKEKEGNLEEIPAPAADES